MASHRAGILHHPWVRSFAFYAAFRAVYGVGILIVTYIVASETQSLSASVGVLIASMIISRVIFRSLSSRRSAEEG